VLPSSLTHERELIKTSLVRKGVTETEKLTENLVARNSLLFLLEAYTMYKNSEYPQSFLSSWIIIENYIRKVWDEFIRDKDTDRKRVGKLLDQYYIDIDHILETLRLSDKLTSDEYSLFMKLKKTRNSIIHLGKAISVKDAEECFQLAINITKSHCDLVLVD